MAALAKLLGETLVKGAGEAPTGEALAGKQAVALYFSAHWCPPCRGFTPKFAKWYTDDLQAKGLEVVFVSSDRDPEAFKQYYGEMPWLALDFADRARKDELSKKYKVKGIPTVVILDTEGNVITADGREALAGDPTGADFPWRPKTLGDIMGDAKLVGPGGAACGAEALQGKAYGLYFSAHWCPPCRGFTPKLAEWYSKDLKAKGFEVVFVSSDKDEAAFNEYFAEMPWLALDFADRKKKDHLSNLFRIQGIPSLVLIDKDGSVIDKEGLGAISQDPTGKHFPWYPRPVSKLSGGPGRIEEAASVVAFCDGCDAEEANRVEEAMAAVAKKYQEAAKASGEENAQFAFFLADKAGGLVAKLRQMMAMPNLPPSKHEHPMEKKDQGNGWGCDGCGCSGGGGVDRYRCAEGCDFDYCGDCYQKATAGGVERTPPRLMLIDIPDKGAFYEGPSGDISTEVVQKFIDDYAAKTLDRKQLE